MAQRLSEQIQSAMAGIEIARILAMDARRAGRDDMVIKHGAEYEKQRRRLRDLQEREQQALDFDEWSRNRDSSTP